MIFASDKSTTITNTSKKNCSCKRQHEMSKSVGDGSTPQWMRETAHRLI